VPVNYLYEDDSVYVHSLPGKKIDALRANPRACLLVDQVEDGCHWRSVLASGCFEEVADDEQRQEVLRKLLNRLPLLTPVESLMAEDAGPPEAIVFRICIDRVTSMAEGESGLAPVTMMAES
jgi:nitroimidazol reductase NimA-like FMN-containing flavoprotein (pyridoxamine 5'-phosphate oxidase superfamily)